MNRSSLILFAFFVLFLLAGNTGRTQIKPLDSLLVKALETDEFLPQLIDSAIKNSHEIKRLAGTIDYASENLKINKKFIFSAFSVFTTVSYGTNYIQQSNNSSATQALSTAQTFYNNTGVGLNLPLSTLLNRKASIRAGQSLIKSATEEKEKAAMLIKEDVIRLYQDFKLSQRLIAICSKNKKAAEITYAMAEKDFIQGQLTIDQVSRLQDIVSKVAIEFETYINRFETNYMQLEAYTGVNFYNLIKRAK